MTASNELPRKFRKFEVEKGQEELEGWEDITSLEPKKLGLQQPLHVISYNTEMMDLGR